MKSTARRHLKEDEFVATLQDTFALVEQHRKRVLTVLLAAVIVAAIVGGFTWWRQQTNAKASALLADAMATAEAPVGPATPTPAEQPANGTETPPPAPAAGAFPNEQARTEAALKKYLAAADAYPSSKAGITARYEAATALADLGRVKEAQQQFQQVAEKAGDGLYGRMGRLGVAEMQARQGQYEPAIATFKELAGTAKDLPVDGILMQLGRTYLAAGKKAEASQTFKRVTDEFPNSAYAVEARQQLDQLN